MESVDSEQNEPPAKRRPTLADLRDLLLRPSSFFTRPLDLRATPLFHIAVVSIGTGNVFERIAASRMIGGLEWWQLWIYSLLGGIVSGYISMWIGGAIYGLRVGWSGGKYREVDAVDMYVCQSAVLALPFTLMLFAYTAGAERPARALDDSAAVIGLVALVAMVWSFVVSYRGVMAKFQPVRWKAVLWFIVLPAAATFAFAAIAG